MAIFSLAAERNGRNRFQCLRIDQGAGFAAMVGHVHQPQLLIVNDRVGTDSARNLLDDLVVRESEHANRVRRSRAGKRQVAIGRDSDAVNVRQTVDRCDAAVCFRIDHFDQVTSGERDIEMLAVNRQVVDEREGEAKWRWDIDRAQRAQSFRSRPGEGIDVQRDHAYDDNKYDRGDSHKNAPGPPSPSRSFQMRPTLCVLHGEVNQSAGDQL